MLFQSNCVAIVQVLTYELDEKNQYDAAGCYTFQTHIGRKITRKMFPKNQPSESKFSWFYL